MSNKYTYYLIIQGNYGNGWCDEDWHECDSTGYIPRDRRELLTNNIKEYRFSHAGACYRVIFRRELKEVA